MESSTRLGRHRWIVERTVSWLAGCRRLHRRHERKAEYSLAFVGITAALINYRRQRLGSTATSRVGHRLGETWRCRDMPSEAFLVSRVEPHDRPRPGQQGVRRILREPARP
ncbi:transposase [Streptomyces sp. MBT62]|nr:transposase [Streptomyces sp. MBT62]